MKVMSVVGARPQFVKLRPVSRALRQRKILETVVHTGQHYDFQLSASFFRDLALPEPDHSLEVGSAPAAQQVGRMLERLEQVIATERPDVMLVFGDTNSTLAGALAAGMAQVPVAHVEAGARSFDRTMPEEFNRVLVDQVSALLFAASRAAEENLRREGAIGQVVFAGDTMLDVLLEARELAASRSRVLETLGLEPGSYLAATVHRAANTDSGENLRKVLEILSSVEEPVVFPVHPRTLKAIREQGLEDRLGAGRVVVTEPLGYLDMIAVLASARMVMTDSGGVQKEAFYLGVPCVTLREETEWVETVELGWNTLVGTSLRRAREAIALRARPSRSESPYGEGNAGEKVAEALASWHVGREKDSAGGCGG